MTVDGAVRDAEGRRDVDHGHLGRAVPTQGLLGRRENLLPRERLRRHHASLTSRCRASAAARSAYRSPAAASFGTAFSICSRSAGVSWTSSEPSASAEPVPAPGADQRHDVLALGQHPRDRDLRDAHALGLGDRPQLLDEREVVLRFSPWKRGSYVRKSPAAVGRFRRQCPLIRPRESTPYAVIPMPSSRVVGRIDCLDAARDQRVLDLQVGHRVHGVRPTDRLDTDLGQADVPHKARLDEL